MLEELHDIFLKCEMARYASSMPDGTEGEEVLEKVKNVIDHIESSKK